MTATSVQYIGLTLTYASSFQVTHREQAKTGLQSTGHNIGVTQHQPELVSSPVWGLARPWLRPWLVLGDLCCGY